MGLRDEDVNLGPVLVELKDVVNLPIDCKI